MSNDTSLQSTKQMLDELDALMERMLSLPVNDLDDASAFPQEVVKAPPLSPTLLATLTLLEAPPTPARAKPAEPPTGAAALEPLSLHPALNPPHLTPSTKTMPEAMKIVSMVAPQPEPFTNEVMPPRMLARLESLLETIAEPAPPMTTQWGYLPLVWINQRFDRSTVAFGEAGGWLRSEAGRTLLGFTGIVLMLGAAGWFLKDLLGWH